MAGTDRSTPMAELTLGQMLDAALRDPKTEPIDFEQLRNLLNGMLGHLGLKDLPIQKSEEPLEGTPNAPLAASMAEDLKQRVEANERAIAEIRALLEELRGDMKEMKEEQSLLAENLQQMEESLDLTGMMENVRNELLNIVMSTIKDTIGEDGQVSPERLQRSGMDSSGEDKLIVIGNEIILEERPRTPKSRQGDTQSRARTLSGDNYSLNGSPSSHPVSHMASDVGQNSVGCNDVGQIKDEEVKMSISKAEALPSPKEFSRGKNLLHGTISRNQVSFIESDTGQNDVGQVKDEGIKKSISKVEGLPSPLAAPHERNNVGQIKGEGITMSISKAPPHIQTKNSDGSFTGLGICPGFPSTHSPIQKVQSAQDHPASQTIWIPAESVAGTNMQPQNVTSQEYLPSNKPFTTQFPGLGSPPRSPARPGHSDVLYMPPPSPGLTTRLAHVKQEHRQREPAGEGYFRRSPMYCGGRHTSNCPVQPMEPLLPDPNKPGEFDLVGRDGLIYRGRQYRPPMGSWMEEGGYSRLQ